MSVVDTSPVDQVLGRLEGVSGGDGQWSARCPSHEDRRASLSVGVGDDGRCLLWCQADCGTDQVIKSLGLTMADLMPAREGGSYSQSLPKPQIVATYDYRDQRGELVFQAVRMEPKTFRQRRPDGHGGWTWSVKGCTVVPYRLPELLASEGPVFIVEGEKDADNLHSLSLPVTCNAGGAGKWKKDHAKRLNGRDVVILPDNDPAGQKHAKQVAASLQGIAKSIKVVELPGLPEKGDVSDWIDGHGDAADPDTIAANLRELVDAAPEWQPPGMDDLRPEAERQELAKRPTIRRFTLAELRNAYPRLREPVVDGLFRQGETTNIIAAPKAGKSWLGYSLALSVITGQRWLETFSTFPGRVLLIDNELHGNTLAYRVPQVAEAMGIAHTDPGYESDLDIWSLRGDLRSIEELAAQLADAADEEYQLIVLDAKYRFSADGESENDNAAQARFYNTVDQIAEATGAAVTMIHHASKGHQAGRSVTDVGAGAGAQSRAADCHLVLREHQKSGHVVLDAAVRSFKPIQPVVLRWEFPLWRPVNDGDPTLLMGLKSKQQTQHEAANHVADRDVVKALLNGPSTNRKLREATGMSRERVQRSLDRLLSEGHVGYTESIVKGNKCREYQLTDYPA